jgi:predicted nucleic acid-binding Zn ribbon protein
MIELDNRDFDLNAMPEQNAYTIISRKEAKERGLKYYFNNRPCTRGHLAERATVNATCVVCAKEIKKKFYANNTEKVLTKNCKWRKANQDKVNEGSKDYTKKNLKQRKVTTRKYRQNNKALLNASYEKRRASKLNATPFWSNLKAIKTVYKESERISIETGIPHQVDHVVPLIHPLVCGLHVPANLQILTAEENLKKGNRFEIE